MPFEMKCQKLIHGALTREHSRRLCCGLLMIGIAGTTFAAQQAHAPVAAGARETSANKLEEELRQGGKILIIDVRTAKEFSAGHVPGAKNIPFEEFSKKFSELKVPKETTIVTVCEHGGRSSRAALELQKLGYKTSSFCTLDSWKKQGFKVETSSEKP